MDKLYLMQHVDNVVGRLQGHISKVSCKVRQCNETGSHLQQSETKTKTDEQKKRDAGIKLECSQYFCIFRNS